MTWLEKLRGMFRSRHEVWLEQELTRTHSELTRTRGENECLRAEVRGLTNSLLGVAGHGPMAEPAKQATPHLAKRRSLHQVQADTERQSFARISARAAALQSATSTAEKPDAQ